MENIEREIRFRLAKDGGPLVKGGYESFNQLKCACYGLQKKKDDPFRYRR